ncbi:MAG: hypothetical protein H7330_13705 [Hymenobacteraceae bacterium]|nr:hypothetical protein [Hymenobacteraceae bacterium]
MPGHLVALACLVEAYYIRRIAVKLDVATDNQVHDYLRALHFFEYWKPSFNRRTFTDHDLDTNLCLWQVDESMINDYARRAQLYFAQQLPQHSLDVLGLNWVEMFNNICDHASSPVQGYYFTQHYPNRQQLVTAVCDFGIGIPTSINTIWQKQKKPRLADTDALRAALRKRMTTQATPRNRGFGLDNLTTSLRALGGELTILSNFAHLQQSPDGKLDIQPVADYFQGTLLIVTLNTATLPLVEEELTDEEFSF